MNDTIFDALRQKNYERVREIVEEDPNVLESKHGMVWTPLSYCTILGDSHGIDLLLELGARFNPQDIDVASPMASAIDNDRVDSIQRFYDMGAQSGQILYTTGHQAPLSTFIPGSSASRECIRELHRLGLLDLHALMDSNTGMTVTQCVAAHENDKKFKAIVELDPSTLRVTDRRGRMAQYYALAREQIHNVRFAVETDPSTIDVLDNDGAALVHHAAVLQQAQVIRLVHARGSDVYHLSPIIDGASPKSYAVYRIYAHLRSLVEILLLCE